MLSILDFMKKKKSEVLSSHLIKEKILQSQKYLLKIWTLININTLKKTKTSGTISSITKRFSRGKNILA